VAEVLLARQYRVVGVARTTIGPVQAVGELVEIQADLAVKLDVKRVVETLERDHSTFDVLLYSAGALAAHAIDSLDYDVAEYLFKVNALAAMHIESQLFDLIARNEADVINITSSSIVDYYPAFSEYSASKTALAKFTLDLQRSLVETRARVTEICPSGFTSSMYETMRGDRIDRDESLQIPVEAMAAFLLSLIDLPKQMEIGRVYVNRKIPS
jgi:NADP-dependent 3-hydroxy acid dehydrogenase YdfG